MDKEKLDDAKKLLLQLRQILNEQNQKNWIQGVDSALTALRSGQFEDAAATYRSMTEGAKGLSEWNIHKSDPNQRAAANKPLDEVRSKLWKLFGR